MIDAE